MDGVPTGLRVGVVRAAPAFLDLAGGLRKAARLVEDAAGQGADVLVFPDAWLPGYPWNLWLQRPAWGLPFARRHLDQAVALDGEPWRAFCAVVAAHGVVLSLGLAERVGAEPFDAQVVVDGRGRVVARQARALAVPAATGRRPVPRPCVHAVADEAAQLPDGVAGLLALDDPACFAQARDRLLQSAARGGAAEIDFRGPPRRLRVA